MKGPAPTSLSAAEAMQLALAEADLAAERGDVPVGAIVLDPSGAVIGRGRNLREVDQDPTGHAEIVAMREAAKHIGHWRLLGCTMVVTLEPCPMCAGALVNARVTRLVFGAFDHKAGAVRTLYGICDDPRLNHRLLVEGGVEAEACAARLRAFFGRLRAAGEK